MFLFTIKHLRNFSFLSFLFLLVGGCNPSLNITSLDINSLYTGQRNNSLHLNQFYSINDSFSTVNLNIPAGLISPDPGTKKYTDKGLLKYEVISNAKHARIVDSANFLIADTLGFNGIINHSWTYKALIGNDYYIKAIYSVPKKKDNLLLLELLSKQTRLSQSWYRFQKESGEYIEGNISAFPQAVRLVSSDSTFRKYMVKHYPDEFPTPAPPFVEPESSEQNIKPDSTFALEQQNGVTAYFYPERTGVYFFQADSATMQGPTLMRMNPGFPNITMHSVMLNALRYITSNKEFQQLKEMVSPKLAVDSFWIANTGRPDLAAELIRKYYMRVETANQLFTSYTEGWKTDRGMIYIVMGKPVSVFRSFDQEIWVYGHSDDPTALRFYFNKTKNPFADNDYVLLRNAYYRSIWYQNVQMWRR